MTAWDSSNLSDKPKHFLRSRRVNVNSEDNNLEGEAHVLVMCPKKDDPPTLYSSKIPPTSRRKCQ